MDKKPSEEDAERILHEALKVEVKSIRRFTTGTAHFVYDVVTTDNNKLVIRLTRPNMDYYFEGAVFWYPYLKDKGLPIATMLYHETDPKRHGFPVMILERLPGEDLGEVYEQLSIDQKHQIAREIIAIQKKVATLPQAKGFGYATKYGDSRLKRNWRQVQQDMLIRSFERVKESRIISFTLFEIMSTILDNYNSYFFRTQPTPFLDDVTTKNVLIEKGKLSGIIDTEFICFGDSLQTLGLTKMSLVARGYDTEYTDFWEEMLGVTEEQKQIINVYMLNYCIDFISAVGQQFNKDYEQNFDHSEIKKLEGLFYQLAQQL